MKKLENLKTAKVAKVAKVEGKLTFNAYENSGNKSANFQIFEVLKIFIGKEVEVSIIEGKLIAMKIDFLSKNLYLRILHICRELCKGERSVQLSKENLKVSFREDKSEKPSRFYAKLEVIK